MRSVLWKCLAVLPLLGLTLWWILGDLPAAPASAISRAGISGPGIDPAIQADSPAAGDAAWRHDALWDDGKAELCAYGVSWAHFGHVYRGRALLVLVKERWNPALDVAAASPGNPGNPGFEVLTLNHIRDVAAGIDTVHQMASLVWRRDSGALQRLATTSAAAGGISYAEMRRGKLDTHGGSAGQGDRLGRRWPPLAFPEDGLPAALRTFVTGIVPPVIEVFPSLMAGGYADLAPHGYRLERRTVGEGDAAAPAGAVELRLVGGPERLTYTFEAALPHRLLRFEREDGTAYQLAKCDRIAYGQLHDPGAEAWLPVGVRSP